MKKMGLTFTERKDILNAYSKTQSLILELRKLEEDKDDIEIINKIKRSYEEMIDIGIDLDIAIPYGRRCAISKIFKEYTNLEKITCIIGWTILRDSPTEKCIAKNDDEVVKKLSKNMKKLEKLLKKFYVGYAKHIKKYSKYYNKDELTELDVSCIYINKKKKYKKTVTTIGFAAGIIGSLYISDNIDVNVMKNGKFHPSVEVTGNWDPATFISRKAELLNQKRNLLFSKKQLFEMIISELAKEENTLEQSDDYCPYCNSLMNEIEELENKEYNNDLSLVLK